MSFGKRLILNAVLVIVLVSVSFAGIGAVKVSFKTLSCGGSKGFASVEADRIVKMESQKCAKGSSEKEVYQILVTTSDADLKYKVFTTTEEQALKIQKAIDEYQADKRGILKRGGAIVVY